VHFECCLSFHNVQFPYFPDQFTPEGLKYLHLPEVYPLANPSAGSAAGRLVIAFQRHVANDGYFRYAAISQQHIGIIGTKWMVRKCRRTSALDVWMVEAAHFAAIEDGTNV
jgi:hypothetical protein